MKYEVVLIRFRGSPVVIKRGLTLAEAQAICSDPETSSTTASNPSRHGSDPWFYGYREE